MIMKKRICALLGASVLLCSLTACSAGNESDLRPLCQSALEEAYAAEAIHTGITITLVDGKEETEYSRQEIWQAGDSWMNCIPYGQNLDKTDFLVYTVSEDGYAFIGQEGDWAQTDPGEGIDFYWNEVDLDKLTYVSSSRKDGLTSVVFDQNVEPSKNENGVTITPKTITFVVDAEGHLREQITLAGFAMGEGEKETSLDMKTSMVLHSIDKATVQSEIDAKWATTPEPQEIEQE